MDSYEENGKGAGTAGIVVLGWITSVMFMILATLALPVALIISLVTPDPEITW